MFSIYQVDVGSGAGEVIVWNEIIWESSPVFTWAVGLKFKAFELWVRGKAGTITQIA